MGKKSRNKSKAAKERMPFVARTFEGLPNEADWIALREFVPSAYALLTLADGRTVRVCSMLPGNGAGLVRADGEVWIGLQVQHNFGDVSRDLAHVVETSVDVEPGNPIPVTDPGVGPRLQDLVDPTSSFDVEVQDGFDYWVVGTDETPRNLELLQQANETIAPTIKLTSVVGAYWTEMGHERFLRWIMTHDEAPLLDALARLRAAGEDGLIDGSRLIGIFRTHGLLVPVWEFGPEGTGEEQVASLEQPAVDFEKRLADALAADAALTAEERSARAQLVSSQVTIR